MSGLLLVEDVSDVTVTVGAPLTHLCPHVDEVDEGFVTITWRVVGQSIELHSLADYLTGFAACRLSHEQVTDRIRHDLAGLVGIDDVTVSTTWATAGMEVRCSTSLTHVGLRP